MGFLLLPRTELPFSCPADVLSLDECPDVVRAKPLLLNVLLCQTCSLANQLLGMEHSNFQKLLSMARSLAKSEAIASTPRVRIQRARKILNGSACNGKPPRSQSSIKFHPCRIIDLDTSDSSSEPEH